MELETMFSLSVGAKHTKRGVITYGVSFCQLDGHLVWKIDQSKHVKQV